MADLRIYEWISGRVSIIYEVATIQGVSSGRAGVMHLCVEFFSPAKSSCGTMQMRMGWWGGGGVGRWLWGDRDKEKLKNIEVNANNYAVLKVPACGFRCTVITFEASPPVTVTHSAPFFYLFEQERLMLEKMSMPCYI
jgi:hypothetical protein